MTATSVYVHFPWCLKKCPYCDFNSYGTARDDVPHEAYADAVLRELEARRGQLEGRTLVSIFVGGGTPSLWDPRALGRVLAGIHGAFGAREADLEVTVECNPTSLDQARAASLREAGVNRISIGVQSLDESRLKFLGRLHDAPMALTAVREARREITRVSADLMFGMPGQKAHDFEAELDRVLETGVDHVSAYALTIEPGTQFGELHKKGRLPVAPDDDYAETFLAAESMFASRGLEHYEVSNYARPGQEARHNLHYWRGGDYVGLGAGAVGCLGDGRGGGRRWRDEALPAKYLEGSGELARVESWEETLSADDRVREALMLGLRTREGVDLDALRARTGVDARVGRERALERRVARGELVIEGARMRVPHTSWLALDAIVTDLF
ncbi:radical SAM family heme chaperone HemW [Sandaracinus amylolyticus]|uniref:radical SAM family heme chaperone HemW n=1 Tax=Sandaracinus amylolyticus TaxID=927083 RepID=UPI001F38E190|nr:radical SAM family heme chaperone HemW [Sandaracinus amylolyticus]UJR78571.1 Coproporphyrinogen III oxidase [Sandaracinus amylolyticus]